MVSPPRHLDRAFATSVLLSLTIAVSAAWTAALTIGGYVVGPGRAVAAVSA